MLMNKTLIFLYNGKKWTFQMIFFGGKTSVGRKEIYFGYVRRLYNIHAEFQKIPGLTLLNVPLLILFLEHAHLSNLVRILLELEHRSNFISLNVLLKYVINVTHD